MSHPPPAPPYRFGATITWVNGVGDIRQQFHTVTDGQAQSLPQLRAMLETQKAYNQPQPTRVSTDKPAVEEESEGGAMGNGGNPELQRLRAMAAKLEAEALAATAHTASRRRTLSEQPVVNKSAIHQNHTVDGIN